MGKSYIICYLWNISGLGGVGHVCKDSDHGRQLVESHRWWLAAGFLHFRREVVEYIGGCTKSEHTLEMTLRRKHKKKYCRHSSVENLFR